MSVYENDEIALVFAKDLDWGQQIFKVEDESMLDVLDYLNYDGMTFSQITSDVIRDYDQEIMKFVVWDDVVDNTVEVRVESNQYFIVRK